MDKKKKVTNNEKKIAIFIICDLLISVNAIGVFILSHIAFITKFSKQR